MQRISITNPQNIIDGTAKKYYFKLRNTGGPKGDKGEKGDTGATGPQGPQGDPCTVVVNSTATLEPGSNAYVTNTGSLSNAVLNFGIPKGDRGPQGAKGDKGDTGAQGDTGPRGPQGEKGTNATVYVGTTSTLDPGSQATVYNSGSDSNAVLNFGIPKGAKGDTGSQGPTGPAGQNFAPTIVTELPATGDESKLYLTPKAHTSQTATGNPITATVSDGAGSIESLKLDGDTFQQSYTGKNLLNAPDYTTAAGTMTCITSDSNNFSCSGTVSETWGFNIVASRTTISPIPAGDYVFSLSKALSFPVSFQFRVTSSGSSIIGVKTIPAGSTSETFTLSETVNIFTFWSTASQNTQINDTFTVQIESGSTATSYEPYVGGQASPSPDYPQTIQTVTGEQTVEIVGKNLAKMANGAYSYSAAGQTFTLLDGSIRTTRTNASYQGGSINISTGAMAQWAVVCASDSHLTGSGGTYTLTSSRTGNITPSPSSARVCIYGFIYDDDGNNTSGNGQLLADLSSQTSDTYTLNLAADRHLGALVFYSQFVSYSDVELKVQLEIGSSASSFKPYQEQSYEVNLGNIELCKLGTYQDYIWKDGDSWKVHKETASYRITGQESDLEVDIWQTKTTRFFSPTALTATGAAIGGNIALSICNRLPLVRNWSTDVVGIYVNEAAFVGRMNKTTIGTTIGEVRSYFANNPTLICYQLATPTDTTITDTTLIAQLEAIRTASLQNGTNTITNSATGSNLAGDMEIGYYGYNPTNRYDKWLWLDLNNNYEQIGS